MPASIDVHVSFWSRDYFPGIGHQLGRFDDDALVSRCDMNSAVTVYIALLMDGSVGMFETGMFPGCMFRLSHAGF